LCGHLFFRVGRSAVFGGRRADFVQRFSKRKTTLFFLRAMYMRLRPFSFVKKGYHRSSLHLPPLWELQGPAYMCYISTVFRYGMSGRCLTPSGRESALSCTLLLLSSPGVYGQSTIDHMFCVPSSIYATTPYARKRNRCIEIGGELPTRKCSDICGAPAIAIQLDVEPPDSLRNYPHNVLMFKCSRYIRATYRSAAPKMYYVCTT